MITEREKYLMGEWAKFSAKFPSITLDSWLRLDSGIGGHSVEAMIDHDADDYVYEHETNCVGVR